MQVGLFAELMATSSTGDPESAEDRTRRLNRERQMRHRRRHSAWWDGGEDDGLTAEGRVT